MPVKAHQQDLEEPHSNQQVVASSELNHRHQPLEEAQARSEGHKHNPHKVKALAHSRHSEIRKAPLVEVEDSLAVEHHNSNHHKALLAPVKDLEPQHRLQEL